MELVLNVFGAAICVIFVAATIKFVFRLFGKDNG